nr:MAG TPA: hypothetical protein [Caudoviricetes sp.]
MCSRPIISCKNLIIHCFKRFMKSYKIITVRSYPCSPLDN